MEKNVLYTDGHDVTLTDSALMVRKRLYLLSAIRKHGVAIVRPSRLPGVILGVLGLLISVVGGESLLPVTIIHFYGVLVTVNQLAAVFGVFVLSFGAWLLWSADERYALSITTEESPDHYHEHNVLTSTKRDYIIQIVRSLNSALFNRVQSDVRPNDKGFQVSAR